MQWQAQSKVCSRCLLALIIVTDFALLINSSTGKNLRSSSMQRLVVGVALGAIAVAVALAAANRGPAKTLLCHVIGINCPKWRFVGHGSQDGRQ